MNLRSRAARRARSLWQRLRGSGSPARAGWSVGLGLFIGCLPLYGLHLPLCLLVCLPLRLDVVAAYLAANISNPLVAPFLLFAEVEIGSYLLTGGPVVFDPEAARRLGVGGFVAQAALGSIVLGAALGMAGGFIASRLARLGGGRSASPLDGAVERTVARYAGAPRGDRYYVASKLRLDPVLARIAELGALGSVLDAGCGRGQLGLALLELGRAGTLRGFDFDQRKVEVARAAARSDARFERGDLRSHAFEPVDTILLVDVLHYLRPAEQDAVLARAASAVLPGGRVIVREVDPERRGRAGLTRLFERIGTALGYNRRDAPLAFRTPSLLAERLREHGMDCSTAPASEGTPLSNTLIVAKKPRL